MTGQSYAGVATGPGVSLPSTRSRRSTRDKATCERPSVQSARDSVHIVHTTHLLQCTVLGTVWIAVHRHCSLTTFKNTIHSKKIMCTKLTPGFWGVTAWYQSLGKRLPWGFDVCVYKYGPDTNVTAWYQSLGIQLPRA